MTIWYDESGQRRGVLSAADFQAAVNDATKILLSLANDGAGNVDAVTAAVSTIPKRRVGLLLAALVTANGATVNSGTYTGVLVKAT